MARGGLDDPLCLPTIVHVLLFHNLPGIFFFFTFASALLLVFRKTWRETGCCFWLWVLVVLIRGFPRRKDVHAIMQDCPLPANLALSANLIDGKRTSQYHIPHILLANTLSWLVRVGLWLFYFLARKIIAIYPRDGFHWREGTQGGGVLWLRPFRH